MQNGLLQTQSAKRMDPAFFYFKSNYFIIICPITHPPTGSHLIMATLLVYFLMVDHFRLLTILTLYAGILSVSSKPPSDRFGFFSPEKLQTHVSW